MVQKLKPMLCRMVQKKKKRASGVCFYLAHAECLSTEGPRWYHPGGWLLTAVDERFTRGIYVFSITNSIRWKNTFCKLVFFFVLKAMCCTDGIKLVSTSSSKQLGCLRVQPLISNNKRVYLKIGKNTSSACCVKNVGIDSTLPCLAKCPSWGRVERHA